MLEFDLIFLSLLFNIYRKVPLDNSRLDERLIKTKMRDERRLESQLGAATHFLTPQLTPHFLHLNVSPQMGT